MTKVLVEDKAIVVPGQVLADGMGFLPAGAAYRDNDKIIALQLGMVNISGRLIKLIPLKGLYVPKINDMILGTVEDITMTGWFVDYGGSKYAMLSGRNYGGRDDGRIDDLSTVLNNGDVISAQVFKVIKNNTVDLTMGGPGLRKLTNGRLITVSPPKVPRIIGKQGSMISMIKDATNCRIIVGQNGIIWIYGPDPEMETVAIETIQKIEELAHTTGLTDFIKEFLEKRVGKKNVQ